MQLSVDVSPEMEQTLSFLAAQSKKSSSEIMSEALKSVLEDMRDYYTAVKAKKEFADDGQNGISWDEMKKELDL